jgi:CRISPR-associated protein Csb2
VSVVLIEARFLSGRVHATPWGHHVNEGLVEWPPSPWRLLRALLSTGFTRLGWTVVPDEARRLLCAMAEQAPVYHLPSATLAHTRHYMPLFDGKTTRVIDAFAHVDGPLVVELFAELDSGCTSLLDRLLAAVPYLGRAESTVEMRRIERLPGGLARCASSDAAPTAEHEGIALLAPEAPVAFRAWRDAAVTEARAALGAKAREKGKAPAKNDLQRLEASLPCDAVDALLAATPDLQREGWSRPPGSRWLSYWRPAGALEARPKASPRARTQRERIDTALLALSSDTVRGTVLPSMRHALYRMEAVHDTLVKLSDPSGSDPSPCFTGSVHGDRLRGHRHASLIPLSLGRRPDRLDHVLVHAPMGFDAPSDSRALDAFNAIRKIFAKDLPDLFVVVAGLGELSSFEKAVPLVAASKVFRSESPFVPPRHLKPRGKDSLVGQVQAELETRGLPCAVRVELEVGEDQWIVQADGPLAGRPWRRFRGYARRRSSRAPPVDLGLSLRVTFDRPLRGPLTLGYASHFGIGVFRPER